MRTMWWTLAVCGLMYAGPSAQQTERTPAVTPQPAHETKLVTGCLVPGPDNVTFRLIRASVVPSTLTTPPASPAESGNVQEQKEYELKAETRLDASGVAPVDMKPFVGHKVEVTARPAIPAASTHEPRRADGEPKQQVEAASSPEKKVEQLAVTAIKQIVGTCQ
jgi:hypothetical protein